MSEPTDRDVLSGTGPAEANRRSARVKGSCTALAVLGCAAVQPAFAWGNEGHQVVATIAQRYLTARTTAAVNALLAKDSSTLTAHTIAAEATWADAYRASSTAAYQATHQWHYADIELQGGSLQAACFGFPALPAGTVASQGPARDCHVDKVVEMAAELAARSTASTAEKVLALKFLLHLVGDLHQPLHTADAKDAGGNAKQVSAAKLGKGSLHQFWDTQFVGSYGTNYATVAGRLQASIGKVQFTSWYGGDPKAWADEAHRVAVTTAYGPLPAPDASGVYVLDARYVDAAEAAVGLQLSRAGVRLAYLLNQAFDPSGKVPNVSPSTRGMPAPHTTVPTAAFVARDFQHARQGDER